MLLGVAGLVILAATTAATAATWYVTEDGAGDGSTSADPAGDLRAVIAASTAGDQVWVGAGSYRPTAAPDRTRSFTLKEGVPVLGGFAPDFSGVAASTDRSPDHYPTILTGDIGVVDINSDNSYHVIYCNGVAAESGGFSTLLDGFTVKNGNADGESLESAGGGMLNVDSNPSINNCVFYENDAVTGGGMYNFESSPAVTNCTFSGNEADAGSGMSNEQSAATVTNCVFLENAAGSIGGGMHNTGSNVAVTDCLFVGNRADVGGGVDNSGGGAGGNTPVFSGCTFTNNYSGLEGGGMSSINCTPRVVNCTFSGNEAVNSGGAMSNMRSSGTEVIGCTFTGNTAAEGSTVHSVAGPTFVNSILWNDHNNEISGPGVFTYCVISDDSPDSVGTTANNNTSGTPLLGALADNGGPTETAAIGADSSAYNAASPDIMEDNDIDTDQRGETRPSGGGYDIGAFELQVATPTGGASGGGGGCSIGPPALALLLVLIPGMAMVLRR